MARSNLLRIDDVLLKGGALAGVLWAFASLTALAIGAESGALGFAAFASAAFATAPLGMLIAGYRLRKREKRAWALHRLIDDHVEISSRDLLQGSDFDDATLDRAIRDLNNAGAAFLVWDREAGVVQDGRLRSRRVLVDDCHECGGKVSLELQLSDLRAARCPYCGSPLDAAHLMEERAKLIDELETSEPPLLRSEPRSDFSLGIFVVLTIIFWPLGLGYAFWHWNAQR